MVWVADVQISQKLSSGAPAAEQAAAAHRRPTTPRVDRAQRALKGFQPQRLQMEQLPQFVVCVTGAYVDGLHRVRHLVKQPVVLAIAMSQLSAHKRGGEGNTIEDIQQQQQQKSKRKGC